MPYRPLVRYGSEQEYREHFERVYCVPRIVVTHDGIEVRFYSNQFDHAFYDGTWKTGFSKERAERIDWIGEALRDGQAKLYVGWNNARRTYNPGRRVCVVGENYVVIIEMTDWAKKRAIFITAFVAAAGTVRQIRNGRKWPSS